MCNHIHTIPACDRQTDAETSCHGIVHAMHTRRAVKRMLPICLYYLNCTKFDQLILRKIIKIVATICQILRLKCTKFDFGREGRGEEGRGRKDREGEDTKGEGRGEEVREGGERGSPSVPQLQIATTSLMVWYSSVTRPTRHIISHFGDDFTAQMTQPTVS